MVTLNYTILIGYEHCKLNAVIYFGHGLAWFSTLLVFFILLEHVKSVAKLLETSIAI